MTEKRFKKFQKIVNLYKLLIKPQYKKYLDEITSLFFNGTIKRTDQAEKLLRQLSKNVRPVVNKLNKLKVKDQKVKPKKETKKEVSTSFHLVGKFILRSIYYRADAEELINDENADIITDHWDYKTMRYDSKNMPKIILNIDHENTPLNQIASYMYYTHEEYANLYTGTYNDCVQQLRDEINYKYEQNDQYQRIDIIVVNGISKVAPDYIAKTQIKNIKMKSAKPLKYPHLMYDDQVNQVLDDGHCVDNVFLKSYPHITSEEFNKLCNEVEEGCNKDDGRSSLMIEHVCKVKDISMYGFDVQRKCFIKHISKNRNYPALVYYCINNHMYHIIDNAEVKSLIETAKGIESKLNSVMFENEESKNIFAQGYETYENIKIEDVLKLKETSIIMYNYHHLEKQLVECINLGLSPLIKKCKGHLPTSMIIKKNKDVQFYLFADQNSVAKYSSLDIDYKVIQKLCKDHEIEFKNQTIVQLTRQLCDRHINEKNKRKVFTRAEREEFLNNHPCCEECDKTLTMSNFQIDHIHPLSAGGTNDENNLQALCKECHFDKTQSEKDNNEHIMLSPTYSSFNESMTEIFNSPLNQHLAFVEIVDQNENDELCNLCAKVKSEYEGLNGYYCKSCYDSIDKLETKINDRYTSWLKKYNRECSLKEFILNFDCGSEQDMKDNQLYIKLLKQQEKNMMQLDEEKEKNEYCIDINGSRREGLYNNPYDIPLFTVMDMPSPYDANMSESEKMKCKFYVESSNHMPLHGNGFYHYPRVKLCLDNGIISHNDIKYVIKASLSTKKDHFNGFIDWCKANMGDHSKLCINSMIGYFAVDKETTFWRNICVTKDITEAYNNFIKYDGSFIDHKTYDGGDFYVVNTQNKLTNIETEKEIYNYIIDLEIVQLYKLRQIIEAKGGKILEYKTDSIRFSIDGGFPFKLLDDKNLDGYFYDKACTKPIYKIEHKGKLQIEMKPKYIRTETFTFKKPKFNIIDDVDDNNFEPLVKKVVDDLGNCFITGCPGAGKTTLIEQIKEYLKLKGIKYNHVLCPTNVSTLNVDGVTLDSFCHKLRSESIILNSVHDYVFVDEVSMVKEMFFKMLSLIRRYKPETKFIICGDYDQFLSVKDRVGERSPSYYKNSGVFHELCGSNMIKLTKCRRSDEKHFNFVKNIDSVKASDYNNEYCDLHIAFTNKKRIKINNEMMIKKYDELCKDIDNQNKEIEKENILKKKNKNSNKLPYPKKIQLEKFRYSNLSQDVSLFVDVPIMAIKNKKDSFVNGEQFVISHIDDTNIKAISEVTKKEIIIEIKNFQRNFHVAYCITSHKSQGATFKVPYTIHEWSRLNKRCKYVSLSRSTTWENCNILDV